MTTQYIAFDRDLLKHVIRQSAFQPPAADFTSGGGWTPVDLNEHHWQMPLFKDRELQDVWTLKGFDADRTDRSIDCMTIKPEFLFNEITEEFVFILESALYPPESTWGLLPVEEMLTCVMQAYEFSANPGAKTLASTSADWVSSHEYYDPSGGGAYTDFARVTATRAQNGREMGWPSAFAMVYGTLSAAATHHVDITNVVILPSTYQEVGCAKCAEQTVIDMRLAWDTNNELGDKGLLFSILADGSVSPDAGELANDFVHDDLLQNMFVQGGIPLPRLLVQEFDMNGLNSNLESVCNNENPPMWFIDSLDHGTSYAEPVRGQDARADTRHLNLESISAILAVDGKTPENYFYQDSSGRTNELNTQYTHLLYGIYRHAPCDVLNELDNDTCVHKRAQQGSATLGADGKSVCASITNPNEQIGTMNAGELCNARQELYGHGFFYLNIDQTRKKDRICLVVGGDQVMPSAGVEECVPTREWLDLQMIRHTRLRQYFPENFANMNPDNFTFWDTEHCVRAWNPLVTRGEDQDQWSMGRRPDRRAAHFMIPERPNYTLGKRLSHHNNGEKPRVDSREQSIYVGQINSGGQAWKLSIRQSSLDVSETYDKLNLPEIEPYEFEWRVGPYWPFYDSIQSIQAIRPGLDSTVKFINDDFTGVVTGQDFKLPRPLSKAEGIGSYTGRISYNNQQIPYISIRPPTPITIKDRSGQAFQNAWNKAFKFHCAGRCQVPKGAPKWLNLKEGARTKNRNTMRRTYSTHLTTELINSSNEGSHESLKAFRKNPPSNFVGDIADYYTETVDDEWLWPFEKLYNVDKNTGLWRAPIYQDDQEMRSGLTEDQMNFNHRRSSEDRMGTTEFGHKASGVWQNDVLIDGDFALNMWIPDTTRLNGQDFETTDWRTQAGLYATADVWWSGSDEGNSNVNMNDFLLPWMKFGRYPDIDINGIKYPLTNRIATGLLVEPDDQDFRTVYNLDGMFQPTDQRTQGNYCQNKGQIPNVSNVNSSCVSGVARSDLTGITMWTDYDSGETNDMVEFGSAHPLWDHAFEPEVIYYMNYNIKVGPSVYEDGLDWDSVAHNTIGYLPEQAAPGWFLGCAPHAKWEVKNERSDGRGPQRYRLYKCGHSPSRIHVGEIEMTQGNVWTSLEQTLVYQNAAHMPNWTSEFHDQMLHLSIIHPYQYAWDEVNMWSESYYNQPGYLFLYPSTTTTTTTDYFMTTTPAFHTLDPWPTSTTLETTLEPRPIPSTTSRVDELTPFRSVIGRASLQLGKVVLSEDDNSKPPFAIAAAGVAAAALVGGLALFAMPKKIMKIEVPIEPSEIGQKFD